MKRFTQLKATLLLVGVLLVALGGFTLGTAQQTALQICVDVPADKSARVISGFTNAHGYQPKVQGPDGAQIDNPVSRRQYMRQVVVRFILESVKASEAGAAAEDARKAAAKRVDDELIIPE